MGNRTQTVLGGCEHMCGNQSSDQIEHLDFLTQTEEGTPDIARVLVVLSKLLTSGSTDTVTFLLAESLAPARRKWRFVVNEAEVTLNAEEMKRALKIERYLLSLDEKRTSWNVEEDKKPLSLDENKKSWNI